MRHFTTSTNKPVLAGDRDTGNYDFFDLTIANMNIMMVSLNLTHPDEVKREVFQNKDFRIGLSYAINRQEIIDSVFQRQGEPWQGAPLPDSPLYDEEMAKQYSEYDVDLANEHLDNAGYTERDGEDFRLGPDGERITITMELRSDFSDGIWVEAFELIRDYWRQVGIEARTNVIDRTLYEQRVRETVDFDGAVFIGHGGLDVLSQPLFYFPYGPGSEFAPAWWFWYGDPNDERGEEPPEAPRRQMELYDQINATPDTDEQIELMRELLQIARDEFYSIGIATYGDSEYGIVKNNFHNVPDQLPYAWLYSVPGIGRPEQFFIENA
jgi:peptide/nickel transport system substrate-binding protein